MEFTPTPPRVAASGKPHDTLWGAPLLSLYGLPSPSTFKNIKRTRKALTAREPRRLDDELAKLTLVRSFGTVPKKSLNICISPNFGDETLEGKDNTNDELSKFEARLLTLDAGLDKNIEVHRSERGMVHYTSSSRADSFSFGSSMCADYGKKTVLQPPLLVYKLFQLQLLRCTRLAAQLKACSLVRAAELFLEMSEKGFLSLTQFYDFLAKLMGGQVVERRDCLKFYKLLEKTERNKVTFKTFMKGVSILLNHSSDHTLLQYALAVLDGDRVSGNLITKYEADALVSTYVNQPVTERSDVQRRAQIAELMTAEFGKLRWTQEGRVGLDDFRRCIYRNPTLFKMFVGEDNEPADAQAYIESKRNPPPPPEIPEVAPAADLASKEGGNGVRELQRMRKGMRVRRGLKAPSAGQVASADLASRLPHGRWKEQFEGAPRS